LLGKKGYVVVVVVVVVSKGSKNDGSTVFPVFPGHVILHNLSWYYLQEQIKRVKPDNSNKRKQSSAKDGVESSKVHEPSSP